ncbi:MAG: hypothetical protein LBH98_06260 [Chitinispirillales bacterium]|jgi:hypothetical protein|nr:hypothetical protein [Chitinispirillales bacterium]
MNIEIKSCEIAYGACGVSFEFVKNDSGKASLIVKNVDNADLSQERKQNFLQKISEKLSSGKKLSGNEMRMLQQNSPVLFQKAVFIEMERKQIKRQLSACKSKKEVQDLYDRKMMQFLTEQKAIERTSMPKEKKAEAMEFLKMRREAFNDEFKEFKESALYKSLPDKRKEKNDRFDSTAQNREEIYFYTNKKNNAFDSETSGAQSYSEQARFETKVNISV